MPFPNDCNFFFQSIDLSNTHRAQTLLQEISKVRFPCCLVRIAMILLSCADTLLSLADPRSQSRKVSGNNLPPLDTKRASKPARTEKDSLSRPAVAGSFSESSTPRVAMTPIGDEAPALAVNAPDTCKSLSRMLTEYTSGIVRTTLATSRHDAARSRLRRSQKDDKRWQERYSEFAALGELQSKTLAGSEKKYSELKKKVDIIRKSHNLATNQIASSLVQHAGGSGPPRYEPKSVKVPAEVESSSLAFERVKADTARLRDDLNELANDVKDRRQLNQKHEFDKIRDHFKNIEGRFGSFSSRTQKQLDDLSADTLRMSATRGYEQDAAELRVSISKIQGFMTEKEKFENRLHDMEKTIKHLDTIDFADQVRKIEHELRRLDTTKLSSDQAKENNATLEKNLDNQKARLHEVESTCNKNERQLSETKNATAQHSEDISALKAVVYGDDNETSLVDLVAEGRHEAKKCKDAVKSLDSAMDMYEKSVTEIKTDVDEISEQLATIQNKPSVGRGYTADLLPDALTTIANLRGIVEDIQGTVSKNVDDITQLREDVTQLNIEQEQKDDLVSNSFDRVDNNVIRQEDRINKLLERVDVVQARSVTEAHSTQEALHLQQTSERLEKLDTRLLKQEDSYALLNEEINTLRSNIQRLPATDCIAQIQDALANHRRAISDLMSKVDTLRVHQVDSSRPVTHSPKLTNGRLQADSSRPATHSPQLTNGVVSPKESNPHVIEALDNKQQIFKQEFDKFKETIMDVTNNHDTFISSLEQRFDNLTTDGMIRCVIHQMQSLYPNHPGNIQTQLQQFNQRQIQSEQRQTLFEQRVSSLVTQLHDKIHDANKKFQQLERVSEDTETNRHQIVLLGAETTKLIEKAKEDVRGDFQQRIKVIQEERHDKDSIVEQDVRGNLERIQGLQKGLQSIRTEHTTGIADLTAALKDVQTIVKSLAPVQEVQELREIRTTVQNLQTVLANRNDDAKLSAIQTSLQETQKKVEDAWNNFITNMADTHGTIRKLEDNIQALNVAVDLNPIISPATSRSRRHSASADHGEDNPSPPSPGARPTRQGVTKRKHDISASSSSQGSQSQLSPTAQLSQDTTGGASMSLGQHSSPVRESTERTLRQESSDSEPITMPQRRKRRKIRAAGKPMVGTPTRRGGKEVA